MTAVQRPPQMADAVDSVRRATISAVLIVKNEESVLGECLDSLNWVDEIVVLDSGSTDRTAELARQHGAVVHVRDDWAGYGVQRQRAQALATCDYVLAIDADERVTPELRASIEAVLRSPDHSRVYEVVRADWFLGKFLFTRSWNRETHVRLYARHKYAYNSSQVHESVDRKGAAVETLRGLLLHYTCRDYEAFLERQIAYAHTWARERASRGKRSSLIGAVLHAAWSFFRIYVLRGGFLDGRFGFLFAAHASQYVFNKYAALWHYSRQQAD